MPPKVFGRYEEGGETVSLSEFQKFEVTIKNLLEQTQTRNNASIDKNTQSIANIAKKLGETNTLNTLNIDKIPRSISDLSDLMMGLSVQITKLVSEKDGEVQNESLSTPPRNGNSPYPYSTRLTKIEFPKFNGEGLKSWLYKCNQFFELDNVNDPQRVKLAAIHLEGRALLWHQNYVKGKGVISWTQYVQDITYRFGELYDDPMTDLKALKQTGTIQEYHDSFDNLASRLNLSQEHLLSCYLGGLDEETQLAVRMFTPTTIQQAHCLAKLQEAVDKSKIPKNPQKNLPPLLPTPKTNPVFYPNWRGNHNSTTALQKFNPTPNPNRRTLTAAEMSDKMAKGLCFWCDEKYELLLV